MAGEPEDRAVEYAKCAADCAYFIHHFLVIDDAQDHGNGGGTMPFHLWPAQTGVVWKLMLERLVIILKARQLGISWICCGYALWRCLFRGGQLGLVFSKGQLEADEMLRRIKVLYERLPDWMIEQLPERTKDNTETQEWANGSRVRSLSGKGGRSFTASFAILDEAAHIATADELFMALKPTIDGGGQLIMLSSALGVGNLFHKLWQNAEAKLNDYCPVFLPWWARPTRTAEWYEKQKREYPDIQMVHQEYPASAEEAFVTSGSTRFAKGWVAAQRPNVRGPLDVSEWPEDLRDVLKTAPGSYVFALPQEGRRYLVSADVAEGGEEGDWSSALVIDQLTWEEVAGWHGHIDPDTFGGYLVALSDAYTCWGGETDIGKDEAQPAKIAPERNNHGHTVIAAIKRIAGVTRIYLAEDGKRGWLTNAKTKTTMIDNLAEALRDELCIIRDVGTLGELSVYKNLDNGSTGAPSGYHDDKVVKWAIAVSVARRGRRVIDADRMG